MSPDRKHVTPAAMLFVVMFISSTLTGAAENASAADPPGGFKALEIGALRLSDKQKEQLAASARSVEMSYPDEALAKGLSGAVVLDIVIESDGSVSGVKLLDEEPQGAGFADAAVKAVSRYTYRNPFERRVARTLTLRFTAQPGGASQPAAAVRAP